MTETGKKCVTFMLEEKSRYMHRVLEPGIDKVLFENVNNLSKNPSSCFFGYF